MELPLVVFLAASCLGAIHKPTVTPLSPLCQDLQNMFEWNVHKGKELQYFNLLQVCLEKSQPLSEDGADKVVDRMIRCGKLEHNYDMTNPTQRMEMNNCLLELNCLKRFYMEEAQLSQYVYINDIPLTWRGKEVEVEKPPSDTFNDGNPDDPSSPSCSKFAKSKPRQDAFQTRHVSKMVAKEGKPQKREKETLGGMIWNAFQRNSK